MKHITLTLAVIAAFLLTSCSTGPSPFDNGGKVRIQYSRICKKNATLDVESSSVNFYRRGNEIFVSILDRWGIIKRLIPVQCVAELYYLDVTEPVSYNE